MKIAERIVMILIVLALIGGVAWIYFSVQHKQQSIKDAVARGEYEIPLKATSTIVAAENWREIYPNTVPLRIGSTTVLASVADTIASRITGLSNTPFLPDNVVKLFVFGVEGKHPIWMKDMNYAIDILWVTKDGKIVHTEENVSPDTYPKDFSSPVLAWYVIEANTGFVAANTIKLGDEVVLVTATE